METGLFLFVILATFFELVLNLSGFLWIGLSRFAFPALLILIGVLLLFGRFISRPTSEMAAQSQAGAGVPSATPTADTKTSTER